MLFDPLPKLWEPLLVPGQDGFVVWPCRVTQRGVCSPRGMTTSVPLSAYREPRRSWLPCDELPTALSRSWLWQQPGGSLQGWCEGWREIWEHPHGHGGSWGWGWCKKQQGLGKQETDTFLICISIFEDTTQQKDWGFFFLFFLITISKVKSCFVY